MAQLEPAGASAAALDPAEQGRVQRPSRVAGIGRFTAKRLLTGSMNRGAVTRLRGCVQENLGGIHRIKSVLLTTEVTTYFNFLALRQN